MSALERRAGRAGGAGNARALMGSTRPRREVWWEDLSTLRALYRLDAQDLPTSTPGDRTLVGRTVGVMVLSLFGRPGIEVNAGDHRPGTLTAFSVRGGGRDHARASPRSSAALALAAQVAVVASTNSDDAESTEEIDARGHASVPPALPGHQRLSRRWRRSFRSPIGQVSNTWRSAPVAVHLRINRWHVRALLYPCLSPAHAAVVVKILCSAAVTLIHCCLSPRAVSRVSARRRAGHPVIVKSVVLLDMVFTRSSGAPMSGSRGDAWAMVLT